MRISVTERQTKKRCLRKWDITSYNRQSLAPAINAPALDFGTIIHKTLELWTAEPNDDPNKIYANVSAQFLSQMIRRYVELVGCKPGPDELKPTIDLINLGSVMIARYKQRWNTPLPPGFTLVENELTLVQDIPDTEHYICNNNMCEYCECVVCVPFNCDCVHCIEKISHQLECTFDGVMADENGDLFIIERKTFSRTPSLEELNRNDQFLAYMWALNKQMPNVVGVAYDGLLKNVKKHLEECFLRRILLRQQSEMDSFEAHLKYEAEEMYRLSLLPSDHPALYPTIPPVTGCQRWECSYIDMCSAMERKDMGEVARLKSMLVKTDRKAFLNDPVSDPS